MRDILVSHEDIFVECKSRYIKLVTSLWDTLHNNFSWIRWLKRVVFTIVYARKRNNRRRAWGSEIQFEIKSVLGILRRQMNAAELIGGVDRRILIRPHHTDLGSNHFARPGWYDELKFEDLRIHRLFKFWPEFFFFVRWENWLRSGPFTAEG